MAWLHAKPKAPNGREEEKSRMESLSEDDPRLEMPEADIITVSAWHSCGMVSSGGMGPAPLSWQEVAAMDQMQGLCLTPWESGQVVKMSRTYVATLNTAKDPTMPAPHDPAAESREALEVQRRIVAERFAAMKEARKRAP